jgi:hypothetical protein
MKLLHQIVGVSVVVIFLLTGQYMDFHRPHMDELDDGVRMMFRSRHLYILLAGLVNISVGAYFSCRTRLWRRVLQWIGSMLIIIAPFLLIAAFFYEPVLGGLPRTFTLPGIISLSVGALCHLFSGAWAEQGFGQLTTHRK